MPQDKKTNQKKKKSKSSSLGNYARYSSIAIQMAVIIGGGTYGGLQLDKWVGMDFPVFTLICALTSVGIAIYTSIKDFLKH